MSDPSWTRGSMVLALVLQYIICLMAAFHINHIQQWSVEEGQSLHYRAKGPIGFLKFKKVVISIHLFLIEKKTQKFSMHLSGLLWPKFCTNFCSWFFLESKYCQNHGQCSEKVEGRLRRGWFFSWWKFGPTGEKRELKIATLTEAPFLVKLEF